MKLALRKRSIPLGSTSSQRANARAGTIHLLTLFAQRKAGQRRRINRAISAESTLIKGAS